MRTIQDVTFETGSLPDDWTEHARRGAIENGVLHSGSLMRPQFILPGHGWRKLRVEVSLEPGEDSAAVFGNSRTEVLAYFNNRHHRVTAHDGGTLASKRTPVPQKDGIRLLVFEFDRGVWRALVEETELIAYTQPRGDAIAGLVSLAFWSDSDCLVHRVRVLGGEELDEPVYPYPARKSDDFSLEIAVDFPDDMSYAPYTLEMLDDLFAEYERWGVRRCHWIYKGHSKRNWWCYFPETIYGNCLKTQENFGMELFDAVVKTAHRHGIEAYAVFKPFEMAFMLHTYGEGTEKARKYGRFSRIGGVINRCPDFAIERRDLVTRRKPGAFGPPENDVFTRIDLVADTGAPAAFSAGNARIFVSDDNNTYRPYEGPIETEETVEDYPVYEHTSSGGRATGQTQRSRVMRFSGLEIREDFFALVAPGSAASFGNTLINLIHVFGPKGEERRITLGITPRAGQTSYDIATATSSDSHGLDFCTRGIEFDNVEGTPSACLCGYDGIREWHAFDGKHSFIGVARGKEETSVGVFSPSFAETRRWWLEWVREILDTGADGVELRFRHHHTHLAWAEFGFEKPVRDEFLARHGVDIWETDDFDRAVWRRLRGEAYTQFFRETRQIVDSCGKRMGLHVSRTMDIEPEQGASMEMHQDWRTWIDEDLADSVTMKEVWPRTAFAEEILSHTRPKGIPVMFSPFANNIWRQPGGAQVCADRIRQAREGGYDGFQYYENCAIVQPRPEGRIEVVHPEIADVFQREFAR